MTDSKTTLADTENKEEQNEQSDARIILGPLVKYAAAGFVLVSIIITTAVMLDRQFNNIDREVAELHAQLAQNKMDTMVEVDADTTAGLQAEDTSTVETEAVQPEPASAEIHEIVQPAAAPVAENIVDVDKAPAVTQTVAPTVETEVIVTESTVVKDAVEQDAVAEAAVDDKANRHSDFFYKSFDQMIAERNNYLKEMDRVYLEEYRASRERHLQYMRERLARHEQRIQEMERRNQEIYDYRAADLQEMQRMRENFLSDRI